MDAEFFEYDDITWQVIPPPARYPVPAQFVRDLKVGDEVTIGVPDKYFIEGQILLRPEPESIALPDETKPRPSLGVCAPIYYWTWRVDEKRIPLMQWWPVEWVWVYQDAVPPGGEQRELAAADVGAAPGHSWLDRVRHDATEPPVLNPVPAREAGALTGRTVRSRNSAGEWFWFVAVSEPVDVGGDICVHAVAQSHWWLHQVTYYAELLEKVRVIPLHRLFAYV
ncbi:hypothetical protein [Cellulosimicrobium funkei]|uniref:hypothetical protein n=1 Tax=Cellulosimicrobium funkei TaxID=264251 RepID=UPI003418124D